MAGRFIAGAGAAMVVTTGQVVLADISTPANRGRTMAVYQGVFLFAVGVGPLPGGLLADLFGLSAPFYAYAALAAVVALITWTLVPETLGLRFGKSGRAPEMEIPFRRQVLLLSTNRGFLLISLVSFAGFFARTGGLYTLIPTHGSVNLHLSPGQIGFGLGLVSVLVLLISAPPGILVDRFGRKSVIVPSTLLNGVALALFGLSPDFLWFVVACAAWAISGGLGGSAPAAYAVDTAPEGMNAAAMSMLRTYADIGYISGPLVLGYLSDAVSIPAGLYFNCILLIVSGLLFAFFAPEVYKRPVKGEGGAASVIRRTGK